jgi:hypothetical protein
MTPEELANKRLFPEELERFRVMSSPSEHEAHETLQKFLWERSANTVMHKTYHLETVLLF